GGVVGDRARQAVGDPRGPTRAPRQFGAGLSVELEVEDARRSADDPLQLGLGVEVEPVDGAEPVAHGATEQALTGGGAYARESRKLEAHRAGACALAGDEVESQVLERRVARLLAQLVQPGDLGDAEDGADPLVP